MQGGKTEKQKKTEYVLGTFFQATGPIQGGQTEQFFFRQIYDFAFGTSYLYGRERVLFHITAAYGGTYIYFDSSHVTPCRRIHIAYFAKICKEGQEKFVGNF